MYNLSDVMCDVGFNNMPTRTLVLKGKGKLTKRQTNSYSRCSPDYGRSILERNQSDTPAGHGSSQQDGSLNRFLTYLTLLFIQTENILPAYLASRLN